MRVKLRTLPSEDVLRDVVHGKVDIGIAEEVPSADSVIRTQILVDELIGIAAPGMLRQNDGWVSPGELARHCLLLSQEASRTRTLTERYLARAQYRPARVWVFDSFEAIKRAVAGGVGVGFMSRLAVCDEIARGELIAFRVYGVELVSRPVQVIAPAFRELTAEAAAFSALVAEGRAPGTPAP